ncbi:MAG: hypothetical protein IT210_00175 [Armatimonadetes bacterium]|nr:hypothetical protein [Armatimonadota bacterium]
MDQTEMEEALGMSRADLGNARRLVALHGIALRFLTDTRQWLVWAEGRWGRSPLQDVTRKAIRTIEAMRDNAIYGCGPEGKDASRQVSRSQQEGAIRAMVNLAQSLPGIAVTLD